MRILLSLFLLALFVGCSMSALAQHNRGVSYYYGKGVPQNSTEAVKWYRLAAEQGEANAQAALDRLPN